MIRKKVIKQRVITAFIVMLLLLLSASCGKKLDNIKMEVDETSSNYDMEDVSIVPDNFQLNFTVQKFSKTPLSLLKDNQIKSIINIQKIDEMVTFGQYIAEEYNEENPEDYTYSYIEISGKQYALSNSLGDTLYTLTSTTLTDTDMIYVINELRGANYGVTIFIKIEDMVPYIISEIDGFAEISDIDGDGTKEVISTVGTVPETSIYFFNFDEETISIADINEQTNAKYSIYDAATNTFRLAFGPNQDAKSYIYSSNQLIRVDETESRE